MVTKLRPDSGQFTQTHGSPTQKKKTARAIARLDAYLPADTMSKVLHNKAVLGSLWGTESTTINTKSLLVQPYSQRTGIMHLKKISSLSHAISHIALSV